MNKWVVMVPIAAIAVVAVAMLGGREDVPDDTAFHVTLASPDIYRDGIYSEEIFLDAGRFEFSFVPNGDSPRILGITIQGETFDFSEDFRLVPTLHETGISEYYTWEYGGQKTITVPSPGHALIEINPNGNVMGPVSVSILKD